MSRPRGPTACEPNFCTICKKLIERLPKETPSMYHAHKYHTNLEDCRKAYQSLASKKGALKRVQTTYSPNSTPYMIMPKIHDRTTNYN